MARSEIDELNTRFTQGMEKGDSDVIASVYAPDAQILPPGSEPLTGPAIKAFWQGHLDAGLTDGTMETVTVEELGDTAIEQGRYEVRVGAEVVDHGKYLTVHRRQPDGSWRIGTDIWNSSVVSAAPDA